MKNLVTLFLLLFLGLGTQACSQYRHTDSSSIFGGIGTVKGSKNYVTKDIRVDAFTKLSLRGSADIVYTQAPGRPKVEVYTSDNIVDLLDIYVKDNTLFVGFKKNTKVSYDKLQIRVSSETLNAVGVGGSGSIDLSNGLKTDDLKISVAGSGDVKGGNIACADLSVSISGSGDVEVGDISCAKLDASVAGSGDMKLTGVAAASVSGSIAGSGEITLRGKAEEATYSISGSGDVYGEGLEVKQVTAGIAGSGDIKCHATENLKVRVGGSGSVGYKGNPQLDVPKKGLYKL